MMDILFTKRTINIAYDRQGRDLGTHFTVILAFDGLHFAPESGVSNHQGSKFETLDIFCQLQQKVFLIQFGIGFRDIS
jgi:hypothetical protein